MSEEENKQVIKYEEKKDLFKQHYSITVLIEQIIAIADLMVNIDKDSSIDNKSISTIGEMISSMAIDIEKCNNELYEVIKNILKKLELKEKNE